MHRIWLLFFLLICRVTWAADWLELKFLRPTQFTVGTMEVDAKVARMTPMSERELEQHLEDHPVDVAWGPDGAYAIDGHHFALAAQKLGIKKVRINVVKDWSDLNRERFWRRMLEREWIYLYRLGEGPFSPEDLPQKLEDMIEDPYRSLASACRRAGGFEKSANTHSEFRWADFFRKRIRNWRSQRGFNGALEQALELAQSRAARKLPGFHGKRSRCAKHLKKG